MQWKWNKIEYYFIFIAFSIYYFNWLPKTQENVILHYVVAVSLVIHNFAAQAIQFL